jgi:NRPS condensation-like uncharacterized protein
MPRKVLRDTTWFKLDNAAKIYPALKNTKDSFVYRVVCYLKEIVKPDVLQQALIDLAPRFPSMFVRIKHGLFWYYLEANPKTPKVKPESPLVNQKVDPTTNNQFLFSVFYYQNRISLESFHSLCDGYAAIEFIKSLVFRYIELTGHELKNDGTVLTVDQAPSPEETEDSFNKYVDKTGKKREDKTPAFHVKAHKFALGESRGIITGRLDANELAALSKKHGATMTQYLTALLTYSIYQTYEGQIPEKRPIKISVPVNMRKYHPSITLRNFTFYIHTTVFAKPKLTFEETLEKIKKDFDEEIKLEKFQASINANVMAEKNFFVRIMPLFIKKIALYFIGTKLGARLESGTISNLGIIKVPDAMAPFIDSFEFNLTTAAASCYGVSVGTFNGSTTISFLRSVYDTSVERRFFKTLTSAGIKVVVTSNFWEDVA